MTSEHIDRTLAALSDPTRRAVIDLLSEEPLRASDIAYALSMSRPAMSRHLRILRRAGLVEERGLEEDARVRIYQLQRKPFDELHGWVEDVEAFWEVRLQAFKRHAERKHGRRPA